MLIIDLRLKIFGEGRRHSGRGEGGRSYWIEMMRGFFYKQKKTRKREARVPEPGDAMVLRWLA